MYTYDYETHAGKYRVQAWFETIDGDLYALYTIPGDYRSRERRAKVKLAKWAMGLHGNAPAGTYYGSFTVMCPDGKRRNVRLYL